MLIRELTLRGILSFGSDSEPLELRPLNLLIGPNGSGKSNLLEAVNLLRATPSDLTVPLRGSGGGISEWLWKGTNAGHASVEALVDYPAGTQPLRHRFEFRETSSRFELIDEAISSQFPEPNQEACTYFYRISNRRPVLVFRNGNQQKLKHEDFIRDQSALSQWKDASNLPELTHLANSYSAIRMYREWTFGRNSLFRRPQAADMPGGQLQTCSLMQ